MSLFAVFHMGCLALLAALLVAAAVQDLRSMRIANSFPIAVLALFALSASVDVAAGHTSILLLAVTVGCAALVFIAGAVAFAAGALGGGDVKLLAAVALFAGPAGLLNFLTVTAIVGGLLGIAILAGAPIGQPAATTPGQPLRARLGTGLPYGPAIAAGGLWIVATQIMS